MRRLLLVSCLSLVVGCKSAPPPARPNQPEQAEQAGQRDQQAEPEPEVPLTADVIAELARERFPGAIRSGGLLVEVGDLEDDDVLDELEALGITTRAQLAAIIPQDYDEKGGFDPDELTNLPGLLRDLMIIHDARRYFAEVWQEGWWACGPEEFPGPAAYGVDFTILAQAGVFMKCGDFDDAP